MIKIQNIKYCNSKVGVISFDHSNIGVCDLFEIWSLRFGFLNKQNIKHSAPQVGVSSFDHSNIGICDLFEIWSLRFGFLIK